VLVVALLVVGRREPATRPTAVAERYIERQIEPTERDGV
jgi:hypothetical protein